MTTERARRLLLDRLGSSATLLLAVLLDLPEVPDWCDGEDAQGRAVFLVGRHGLGDSPEAAQAVQAVLDALHAGEVPEGVLAIGYASMASRAIAEVVAGTSDEVLMDGPRGSGKTQAVPAALAILAERHARAGYSLPLLGLWLHDSLTNAALKTGRSLEQMLWGGLWQLRDDRREAVFSIAGREMVKANFVGCRDETAAERLRAECHVLAAEELVASLDEAGGIEERKYELGLTSMRLPTRRRVALSTTNPGAPDSWPYQRFIAGARPGCVRCPVPATDRLSREEVEALRHSFRDSPDLQKRLALGEWAELQVGEVVAVGFFRELHVAPAKLEPCRGVPFFLGQDGGLTPTTIIAQHVQGELRVYAALTSDRAGMRQHLESLVLPWFAQHAYNAERITWYDPAMETPDFGNIESSPEAVMREVLGGGSYPGPVSWPGRRDPLLTMLSRLNPYTGRPVLQLCPEGCSLLTSALSSRWHYPTVNGKVSRDLPVKDHPWSDLGDALCYLVAGMLEETEVSMTPPKPVVVETEFVLFGRKMGSPFGGR